MRQTIWLIPVDWLFRWWGIQCLAVCITLEVLRRWLHHIPGDDRAYFIFVGLPGAFFLARWIVRGLRRVVGFARRLRMMVAAR